MRKTSLSLIFLVVFLDLVGFGIVIPVLPYYAKIFGASATELGWLMVCYSGMQFLFSPFWGRLSDRIGRRPVLLTCILGIAISFLILGSARSLLWLFIGRLFAGLFGANISAASAYIADITPPEKRAKGMGLIGAAFGLGFLFGPALGGLLSKWGYHVPALVAAALAAINFLFAFLKLEEPKLTLEERTAHRHHFTFRNWIETVTSRQVGFFIGLFFLMTMGIAQLETSFALYLLARFGLDALHAGVILAMMAVCMIAIQGGGIGPLVAHFGERFLVATGALLMTCGLVGAMLSPTVHWFVVALLFHAVGYALVTPSLSALTSKTVESRVQGATMGVYQSAGSLGRIVGPLLAGILFDRVGMSMPFYVAAGFFMIAFILSVKSYRSMSSSRRRGSHEIPA
ncbi:MAG: hypothetical protein A3I05_02995 [Deltaproteobacteria bacterium RIFCSPLOWO2_02_FULL_44_10]|nr:MAG: hypothetical protein A3C46_09120 [Deltaproteobacteria bacterium RIFCSPHIGHO2_02_FULL_44_16]OGQ46849.1 MAG: hypothetical protein A3I05_02995 [Deltaproteobacteria bacterium RIFCSPLOWO2_02_FULL_44_10]